MLSLRRFVHFSVAAWSLACSSQFAYAQTSAVTRLSWLAGCWRSESPEAGSVEHWMPPAAGTMFGVSRTVKAGKTIAYEFIRVHETPEGKLLFVALPSGQKETVFTQLRLSDTEVVFENPDNDFPQRVIYRRQNDTSLLASIEGMRNGTLRTVVFPMRRISCETQALGTLK